MTKTQDAAVRNYLVSLRDPTALRDDDAIADLQSKIEQSTDELERLQLLDLQTPPAVVVVEEDRYRIATSRSTRHDRRRIENR